MPGLISEIAFGVDTSAAHPAVDKASAAMTLSLYSFFIFFRLLLLLFVGRKQPVQACVDSVGHGCEVFGIVLEIEIVRVYCQHLSAVA